MEAGILETDPETHLLQMSRGQLRTAYLESLGCAANRADRSELVELLSNAGWSLVQSPEKARAIVVLTCGFTAQAESFGQKRLRELASQLPEGGRLLIGGCLPAIAGQRLSLPGGAFVFGPTSMPSAVQELQRLAHDVPYSPGVARRDSLSHEVYPLRVSTGCRSRCTFCAIPEAAGRTKSKSVDKLVEEVRALEAKGIRAVHLTSEDFSAFGLDLGIDFIQLVTTLLEETQGVRFTLDTLNPRWISSQLDELADLLLDARIDKRIYVPLQSGSSRILKRMARGYTEETARKSMAALSRVEGVKISTDIIVGFPGESQADFERSRALILDYPIEFLEVFAFSEREGTPAAELSDSVEPTIRAQRAGQLIADFLMKKMRNEGIEDPAEAVAQLLCRERLPVNTNMSPGTVVQL